MWHGGASRGMTSFSSNTGMSFASGMAVAEAMARVAAMTIESFMVTTGISFCLVVVRRAIEQKVLSDVN